MYRSPIKPFFRPLGASSKVSLAAENSMMKYLEEYPWAMQNELVQFLWEEWGLNVYRLTVSRILKRRKWNRKKAQRLRERQNEEFRIGWRADMLRLTAEQLAFLDESLFNETTGWRHNAHILVSEPARYHVSRRKGYSWSVLPAYTIDGYLSYIGVKEG